MKKLIQQFYIIMTVLLFMWQGSVVIAQCNHPDDYTALRALYLATDGDNWTIKTGWPTRAQFLANPTPFAGIDMSEWYAVTCDGDRVQVLYLIENNLIGKIPVEIGNLTFVLHLSLFNNQLEGNIPVEIGNLSLLKYLSLANNQLIGNIPKEFGNLLSLEILSLTSNKISGNIPKEIGSLLKLNSLSLDFNQLSGNIPVEIKNLKKLNILNLDSNKLTGSIPKELGDLSELGILKLGSNQFTGIIPKELGMMTNLNLLWLYNNQLSGNIPKELGNLTNLVNLFLYDNQLTGNLPIELGKLYNLSNLQIYRNEISGNIPKELGNLTSLSILLLWSNNINGNIPKELGSLRNLTQLSLSDNKLTGDIPKELSNLNKLNILSLSNNQLTGRIPGELSSLNLYYLNLNNNNLDGCIDYQFKRLCDSIFVDDLNNPGELVKIISNVNFLYNPKLSWKGDFALFCNSDGSQQAQIGAPCDNGNPADGTNDVIQDDCRCGLLPPCNHPDYAPIMELYNSTNGPNWINNTGWADGAAGTNCDPCNGWYGITCDSSSRIYRLQLSSNLLNGNLPESLGDLTNLKYLDFGVNILSGNLPESLGDLTNLEYLDLSGNILIGEIPESLGNLVKLKSFNLFSNRLDGEIPFSLGNLVNLEFMHLGTNKLSGEIPISLGNLTKLETLNLFFNNLGGEIPASIGNLTKLHTLFLFNNTLSGEIPESFGNLVNLKLMILDNNKLQGEIPASLGNLVNLELMYLNTNKLSGEIPASIGNLSKLQVLNLTNNQINGEIPSSLGNLSNLGILSLGNNNLTGGVPTEFANFKDSIDIYLSNNQLSGCFPKSLLKFCVSGKFRSYDNTLLPWYGDFTQFCATDGSQQAQIGSYCYNHNWVDGPDDLIQNDCSCGLLPSCNHPDYASLMALYNSTNGPGWTNKTGWEDGASGTNCDPCNGWYGVKCDSGRVETIVLRNNNLSGFLPKGDTLAGLDLLRELFLSNNKINGEIPPGIGNIKSIETIEIIGNLLTGLIPENLGNAKNLRYINLRSNKISGVIPDSLMTLGNLYFLDLRTNNLTGSIPININKLKNLSIIDLYGNNINGQIPSSIGELTKLGSLNFGFNRLSGALPTEIINLTNLVSLELGGNMIGGNIPIEMGSLTRLSYLSLSGNLLTGEVPKSISNLIDSCYISLRNNNLSGCFYPEFRKFCGKDFYTTNNRQLPWQGDFTQFCATDGSPQAQKFAPCDNGNPADGINDLIDENCNCVPCTTMDANITGPNAVCQGESATFTAVGGTSYLWSNGATTADITVNTAGTYSVTVTDVATCEAKGERSLTINANPTAVINGANEICEGSSAEFTATGGVSYVWNTTATTDKITVNTAGSYSVTVTNAFGCTSTVSKTLSVNNAPTATITGANAVCQGASATFTAVGGASYIWSNGATTADITVNAAGTYSVTVTDSGNCEAKGERILTVNANPIGSINGANEICEGSSTEFTATGGASYVWNTTANTDKITVNTAGTYSVTVTDANGCTSETNKTLAVANAPTATITGTNAVCQGESATFTAVGGISYIWSNGSTTPDITINAAGTYRVTVTDANYCEATGEGTLTINASPIASINGANEICEGSSTEFIATGGASYLWNTTATTDKITVNTAGSYSVTVTDANGCTSESNKTLTVAALPIVTITGDKDICEGESTTLTATGGTNYLWSNGATTADIIVNVAGTYSVTVTSIQGCYSTGSTILTLSNTPTVEITGINEICEGEIKILTASGGTSYVWNTGATSKAIQINSGGIYTVSVTNNNGCVGNTSFRVTLLDDTTLPQTKNDTLYVDQGSSYQVDLLQNDILFTDSIKVQLVNIPQAFIRVLSFDEKGRISLEVKEVFIETLEIGYEVCDPCNPCVSGKLIILNEKLKEITQTTLMTPLQSTNNTLQFSIEPIPDSELWIYNRWGQQILHSKNYQNDWDANGYPGGVYYYVFKVYGFTIKRALTVVK